MRGVFGTNRILPPRCHRNLSPWQKGVLCCVAFIILWPSALDTQGLVIRAKLFAACCRCGDRGDGLTGEDCCHSDIIAANVPCGSAPCILGASAPTPTPPSPTPVAPTSPTPTTGGSCDSGVLVGEVCCVVRVGLFLEIPPFFLSQGLHYCRGSWSHSVSNVKYKVASKKVCGRAYWHTPGGY